MHAKFEFPNRCAGVLAAALLLFFIALPFSIYAGESCPAPCRGKSAAGEKFAIRYQVPVDGKQIVTGQLAGYKKVFPDITFVWLRGKKDLPRLQALPLALGKGADDEAYEHGPEVRKLLLEAEFGRIARLIQLNSPSSTLFRTGQHTDFKTPHVCVITLDDRQFLTDPLAASRFFLGAGPIPKDLILAPVTTMRFTLNHEVFHCLDAYMNGPMFPKTYSRSYAQYSQLQAEMRADFFASLMLRKKQGSSDFVRALAKVRTLGLLSWDLAHFTRPALSIAQQEPLGEIKRDDIRAMAEMARRVVHKLQPNYAYFERWRASIYKAVVSACSQVAESEPISGDMQEININPKTFAQVHTQLTQITREFDPLEIQSANLATGGLCEGR